MVSSLALLEMFINITSFGRLIDFFFYFIFMLCVTIFVYDNSNKKGLGLVDVFLQLELNSKDFYAFSF